MTKISESSTGVRVKIDFASQHHSYEWVIPGRELNRLAPCFDTLDGELTPIQLGNVLGWLAKHQPDKLPG